MKLLTKAPSIIQRDALLARLSEAGIETVSPPRDMSRKVTETTVDLALDGYSVFFDGFAIYVNERDEAEAKQILAEFERETAVRREAFPEGETSWRRYYFSSLFSLMLPIVLSLAATLHLIAALKSGVKPASRLSVVGYTVCFILGWALSIFMIVSVLPEMLSFVRI